MSEADNLEQPAHEDATAASQEPSVPKYRFDELASRLKRMEEENAMKDQLIQSVAAQRQPQQVEQELTPESLGIDADTYRAAQKLVAKQVAEVEKKYQGHIGHLANSVEETQFLQRHPDASRNLEDVKAYRNRNYQVTGNYLPLSDAYKGWVFDQRANGVKPVAPKKAAPVAAAPEAPAPAAVAPAPVPPPQELPNAAATAPPTSVSATAPTKSFEEMTVDEMEASLETRSVQGEQI